MASFQSIASECQQLGGYRRSAEIGSDASHLVIAAASSQKRKQAPADLNGAKLWRACPNLDRKQKLRRSGERTRMTPRRNWALAA